MKKAFHRCLALSLGALLAVPLAALAQDWYEASGKPVARSLVSSADLRTEFAAIQSNISGKLPALAGNGGRVIAVNAGGTALEALAAGVPVDAGGTGATTASGARTNLGLVIGTDVQAFDADLSTLAGLAKADGNFIVGNGSTWVVESGSTARSSLGLGSLATASSINNGNWSGTDLAVTNGGTGASDASTARTNLGLAIGTDVQAYDADLATIAALAKTDGNFIVGNGSAWVAESGSTARSSLGLGSLATLSTVDNDNWGTDDLSVANGGTGSSTASGARSNLGLGSLATASTINNSNWSGTDLAIANGGTGASDAATARSNLGAAAASHNHSAADITSGTLAVSRGGTGQTTMDNLAEQVWLQCTIQSDPGGTPSGSPGDCFLYY